MRQLAVLALALLALAPACQVDEPGQPPVDDRPRGERCDEMQACGRSECQAEIDAVWACNDDDLGCGADLERWSAAQQALAECLDAAGCNTTTCDLVGAFTDRDVEEDDASTLALYCDIAADAEIVTLARSSMFVDSSDAAVVECQALE